MTNLKDVDQACALHVTTPKRKHLRWLITLAVLVAAASSLFCPYLF
jgi:hypothetical protein